jgi:hypothetical protein
MELKFSKKCLVMLSCMLLIVFGLIGFTHYKIKQTNKKIHEIEFKDSTNTYNKIYYETTIKELKKKNRQLYDSLEASKDRASEDWHKQLTDFNSPDTKVKKNPISINNMVVIKYWRINWISAKNYGIAYNKYDDELSKIRMRHGVGLQTNGKLGDSYNQKQDLDSANGLKITPRGTIVKPINAASRKTMGTTIMLFDADGNKVAEIPVDVAYSMMKKPSFEPYIEKEVREVLTDENALKAYAEAKAELEKKFLERDLDLDRILTISANIDGVGYYYINDKVNLKSMPIDQMEMIKFGEKLTNAEFQDMYSLDAKRQYGL